MDPATRALGQRLERPYCYSGIFFRMETVLCDRKQYSATANSTLRPQTVSTTANGTLRLQTVPYDCKRYPTTANGTLRLQTVPCDCKRYPMTANGTLQS
jgi:hypothetical protein